MKNKKLTALILCITMLFSITSGIFSAAFASDGTTGSAYSLDTTTDSVYSLDTTTDSADSTDYVWDSTTESAVEEDKGPMLFSTKAKTVEVAEETPVPDYSAYAAHKGMHATFSEEGYFEAVSYKPTTFKDGGEAIMYNTGNFSEDILFKVTDYTVVHDYYESTKEGTDIVIGVTTVSSLWYQLDIISGEATGTEEGGTLFQNGFWVFQNYLAGEEAYEYDTLTLFAPEVGKIVQFNTVTPILYKEIGKTDRVGVDINKLNRMVIEEVTTVGDTTWYYVVATDGAWPEEYVGYHYVKANMVEVVEQEEEEDERSALQTTADGKAFAIYDANNALPAGAALTVETSEDGFVEFVREGLFGSSTLPDGLYDMAYDISIGDEKLVDGRTVKVRIGNIETAGKDFLVIHFPGKFADGMLEPSITPEALEVTVGNDYIEFETSGFSNYYVISGTQGSENFEGLLDLIQGQSAVFYVLRETEIVIDASFTSISYNDGPKWNSSNASANLIPLGINFKYEDSGFLRKQITFSTTNNAQYGKYTIKGSLWGLVTYTIHVISAEDMFDSVDVNKVFFKVLDCRNANMIIPSEPISSADTDGFNYITSEDTFSVDGPEAYNQTDEQLLNLNQIGEKKLMQNTGVLNLVGLVAEGTSMELRELINKDDGECIIDWDQLLLNYIRFCQNPDGNAETSDKIPVLLNDVDLTNYLTDTNEDQFSSRYQLYPYAIKLLLDTKETAAEYKGWHVECAIADTEKFDVTYRYNFGLNSAQVIPSGSETVSIPNVVSHNPGDNVNVAWIEVSTDSTNQYPELTVKNGGTDETFQYKFVKWNTKADGTGEDYFPGGTITNISEDKILYAIWQKSAPLALAIRTIGSNPIDEHQSYIFNVSGPDGFNMDVVLHGDDNVVITNLKSGDYTVTPKSNWSWRYTMIPTSQTKRVGSTEEAIAEFSCNRSIGKAFWLDGNAWRRYSLLDSSNNIITEALPVPESSSVSLALVDMALRENDADEDLEVQLA